MCASDMLKLSLTSSLDLKGLHVYHHWQHSQTYQSNTTKMQHPTNVYATKVFPQGGEGINGGGECIHQTWVNNGAIFSSASDFFNVDTTNQISHAQIKRTLICVVLKITNSHPSKISPTCIGCIFPVSIIKKTRTGHKNGKCRKHYQQIPQESNY